MRVLIDILHPAHVHFFKYVINILKSKDHDVLVTAREKDVTVELLDLMKIPYIKTRSMANRRFTLYQEFLYRSVQLKKICAEFQPDVLTGISGANIASLGRVIKTPSVVFTDTEAAGLQGFLGQKLSTYICTPNCFGRGLGEKHYRYAGFQELAYLHPTYFKPDPSVFELTKISKDSVFFVLRFVGWTASHDVGHRGLSIKEKSDLIKYLQKKGKIIIVSESNVPRKFQNLVLRCNPNIVHSLLFYSKMLIGDSQTMTTEAGLLGTPGIRCNSLVGTEHGIGNMNTLENRYKLIYSFQNFSDMMEKVTDLLQDNELKKRWHKKREEMLRETVDVSSFAARFLERVCQIYY